MNRVQRYPHAWRDVLLFFVTAVVLFFATFAFRRVLPRQEALRPEERSSPQHDESPVSVRHSLETVAGALANAEKNRPAKARAEPLEGLSYLKELSLRDDSSAAEATVLRNYILHALARRTSHCNSLPEGPVSVTFFLTVVKTTGQSFRVSGGQARGGEHALPQALDKCLKTALNMMEFEIGPKEEFTALDMADRFLETITTRIGGGSENIGTKNR